MVVSSLSTIGSIAIHINDTFNNIPSFVSGEMVTIVDMSRQHVSNFTGDAIGSNSIDAKYQPAIVAFSKADTIDLVQGQAGGEKMRLAELSIEETGEEMSAKSWRVMGEDMLRALGRKYKVARSVS